MPVAGSQLSATKRPTWHYITVGVLLIVVAVTLTVAWQIMGVSDASRAKEMSTLRWVVYFLGTVLFLLLIGGLVVIVTLLVREVRLNERQSNFVSAVTHELKTPSRPSSSTSTRSRCVISPRAVGSTSTGPCARTSTA